jgi:heat shock protein HslJ
VSKAAAVGVPVRRFVLVAAVASTLIVASLALAGCSSSGELTGKTWQWTGSTTKDPASESTVSDPQNYTLVFLKGAYTAKADCNTLSGTWVTASNNGLKMTPTSSSDNACAADSRGKEYSDSLAKAASYGFDGGKLKITLSDQGTMTFK